MMRICLTALIAIFFLTAAAQADDGCKLDQYDGNGLVNLIGRYTAKIEIVNTLFDGTTEREEGTAFLVTFDGYVVTAKHVVANPSSFQKQSIDVRLSANPNLSFRAHYVDMAEGADVALLQLDVPAGFTHFRSREMAFPIATSLNWNETVALLGYPIVVGDFAQLLCGDLNAPEPDGGPYWYTTVPINAGASGGPVIGPGETLLALAEGKATETTYLQQTRPLNDVFLLQPIAGPLAGAYSLSDLIARHEIAKQQAIDPDEPSFDLKAVIDHYYVPRRTISIATSFNKTSAQTDLFGGGSAIYSSSYTAPKGNTISECSVAQTTATNSGAATCAIDATKTTATVSVALDNESLLSSGGQFAGQVSLKIDTRTPPASAPAGP